MFSTDGRAFHRPLAISVAGLMLAGVGLAVTALILAVAHRQTAQALAYIPVAIGLTAVAYRCPQSQPAAPARVRSNGGRAHQLDLFQYRVRAVLLVRHTLARSATTPTCVLTSDVGSRRNMPHRRVGCIRVV